MLIKRLRTEKGWTQEQLSQMSGLGLRTVQRLESGAVASLESKKALASVFEISIEQLEQETMAIDKSSDQWKSNPWWVRLIFWGSNYIWLDKRKDALIFEIFLVVVTLGMFAMTLFGPEHKRFGMLSFAFVTAAATYMWSVLIRLSDQYSVRKAGR